MAPLFHRRQTSKDEHGHVTTRQHQNVNVDVHNAQEGSQLTSVENNVGHFTATDTATIRKYLVLLQDCLAIKFVPLASQQSHPFPFAFNNNNNSNNSNNNNGNGQSNGNGGGNSSSRTHNYNGDHQQLLSNHHHHHGSSSHNQNSNHQDQNQKSTTFPLYNFPSTTTTVTAGSRQYQQLQQNHYRAAHAYYESSTAEVDHSLHGLYLYKGFREANLQCFWNAALYETFQNIDYKGYIVPSTILVSALPRFLAILRTAWSRQMLRTPPGYRIEFIGEIEELIADPIQQGQFAPLSDSLCWAILEITSIGQEAFVDSILMALATAFPTMVQPARELVYQTLEKLIRERKVYQTSHGYFVVTPDTFRYMASSNFVDYDPSSSSFFSSNTLTLDALLNPHYESDKLSFSRHSWDSNASADNPILSTGEELADDKPTLKRHNSLKIFRQKDLAKLESSGLWGTRSLSMRLSKSKSKSFTEGEGAEEIKGKSLTMDNIGRKMKSLLSSNELSHEKVNAKNKKNKSFLSKLFPFRRSSSKSRNEKSTPVSSSSPPSSPEASKKKSSTSNNPKVATTSTQTSSSSVEHLTRLKCSQGALLQERQAAQQQHQHTRFEDDPLACDDTELFSALSSLGACSSNSKWNSLPVTRDRPSSRRSISILDEGPFYDTPNNNTGNGNNNSSQISPNHPAFPGFHRGESSRCSTLSQAASSLGYGSQGQQSLNFSNSFSNSNSQSHSPCPSTSASATYAVINNNRYPSNNNPSVVAPPPPTLQIPGNPHASSYRNSYDFYRRRYPSYNPTNQFQRGSHNYSSLISPITHSNTKSKTHKTTPTYETISSRKSEATVNKKENLVDNVSASVINKNPNSSSTTTTTTSSTSDPFVTTTTVTQNMKTTTNMELELLLPLGKLMGAALAARRDPKNTSNKVNINLETSGAKIRVGEPKTSTEVKTTINNNGRVETHFECTPGISSDASKSRVEIKTNDPSKTEVIVTQTQPQSQQKSSSSSSEQKNVKMNENSKQGYTSHFGRKSSRGIVKIADIGKDSDEDIKQCVKVKGSA